MITAAECCFLQRWKAWRFVLFDSFDIPRHQQDSNSPSRSKEEDDDKLISFDLSLDEDRQANPGEDSRTNNEEASRQDYQSNKPGYEEQDLLGIFDDPNRPSEQQPGLYGDFESAGTEKSQHGGTNGFNLSNFSLAYSFHHLYMYTLQSPEKS